MMVSRSIVGAAASALLVTTLSVAGRAAVAAERLPSFNVDLGQTTVSGLSSGAFMTVQFHIAFSGTVRGAGVVAGGPYYCAEGQLYTNALNRCMQTGLGPPDADRLLGIARSFARDGRIDPLENLADDRAYLFTGTNDRTVVSPVMDAARRFYLAAGLPAANLVYRSDLPAGHGMVTETFGNACSRTAPPYINDCDFDLAGVILGQLYPGLRRPAAVARPGGTVLAFDQTEFFRAGTASISGPGPVAGPAPSFGPGPVPMGVPTSIMPSPPSAFPGTPGFSGAPLVPSSPAAFPGTLAFPGAAAMPSSGTSFTWCWPSWPWCWSGGSIGPVLSLNDTGFAYVPAACAARNETCRVHIVFHGCKQTVEDVQEQYVRNTGYNRWAESNNIIVLYPQARSEPQANPNGCWDWWGYSGVDYATKTGPQMAAVRKMLDRLAGR